MLASSLLALLPVAAAFSDKGAHQAARSRARAHYGKANALAARGTTYSGRATYYAVGLGACGDYNSASDYIVALNSDQYGSGSPGPQCFKSITISYNGKTAVAEIMDECPSCSYGDLDLSEGLFDHFADESLGEFEMTWWFNDDSSDASSSTTTTSSTSTYVPPTSTYTPPTSTWTPTTSSTSTSTYVAPTSTYTPSASTYTPPPSTSSSPSSSAAPTSTEVSTTAALTSSAASSIAVSASTAMLNGTAIPDVIVSNGTASTSVSTGAAASSPAAGALGSSGSAGTNLVAFNDLVSQYGRLVVVAAGGV
ncbi:hypothetical protein Q5752_002946 [Cryptotrichosporon argae]